jgi:hypothetical protein
MATTEYNVRYVIGPKDTENYLIKALILDKDENILKEISMDISMKNFNELIVYSEEEKRIKDMAEEIVKNQMYKTILHLLENDIKSLVDNLKQIE